MLDPGVHGDRRRERRDRPRRHHGRRRTAIDETTTEVLLESAHFAPDAVAGRARRLGLFTDAAQRFERGVDPTLPALALERATALLLEIAGGTAGPSQVTLAPAARAADDWVQLAPQPLGAAARRRGPGRGSSIDHGGHHGSRRAEPAAGACRARRTVSTCGSRRI